MGDMDYNDYMLETPKPDLGDTSQDPDLPDHGSVISPTESNQYDCEDSYYDPERPHYNNSDVQITLDLTTPYSNYNQEHNSYYDPERPYYNGSDIQNTLDLTTSYSNFYQEHTPDNQGYITIREKLPILPSTEVEKELKGINNPSSSRSRSPQCDKAWNDILRESGLINPHDTSHLNVAENSEHQHGGQEEGGLTSSEAREEVKLSSKLARRRARNKKRRADKVADSIENNKGKNIIESKNLSKRARARLRKKERRMANKTNVIQNKGKTLKDSDEIEIISETRTNNKKRTSEISKKDVETTKKLFVKRNLLNRIRDLLCPQVQLNETELLQAVIEHLGKCNK